MTVEIRLLGPNETAVLERVADDVFDNPVDRELAAAFLREPHHYLCAALDASVVVGFASALSYLHPDKPWALWIDEVGVAPSHQRQGVGKALMHAMLTHARALGCTQAWVATEEDNVPARALYRAAGGTETRGVVMATFPLTP